MALYGKQQLAESMRAVRANTIAIASDIPEGRYDYRATPTTRSIGETLVHIAWLFTSDLAIHQQARISTVEGFDFVALMKTSEVEEKRPRSKTRKWRKIPRNDRPPRRPGRAVARAGGRNRGRPER